jgi:hypothetical protein
MKRLAYAALTSTAAIAAGFAARKLVTLTWNAWSEVEAPVDPVDRHAGWSRALGWGIAAGAAAGVARVLGRRLAAAGWERAMHEPPPVAAAE